MRKPALGGLGQTCGIALPGALRNFRAKMDAELARRRPIRAQHGMTYVTAPCIEACPSKVNVPRYIDYVRDGKPEKTLGVLLQKYPMAATRGRVCVRYCEQACRRKFVDDAVGIKTFKRFVADRQNGPHALKFTQDMKARPLDENQKVAVIGAGPAGISCAYHLLLRRFLDDVFEKADQAGGLAQIGIPSYRLPKNTLAMETDIIADLDGRFLFGQQLGTTFTSMSYSSAATRRCSSGSAARRGRASGSKAKTRRMTATTAASISC